MLELFTQNAELASVSIIYHLLSHFFLCSAKHANCCY